MNEKGKEAPARSGTVSLEGVDQAIESLGYRSLRSPKSRLVEAIREYYRRAGTAEAVTAVCTDDLMRLLWDVPEGVPVPSSRRRNLSSLRSSVNADLLARYHSGENPEGVIISPENGFVICDEAKDRALQALQDMAGGGGDQGLKRIGELLRHIGGLLDESAATGPSVPSADPQALDDLREAVQGLAARLGVAAVESEIPVDSGAEGPSAAGPGGGVPEQDPSGAMLDDEDEAVLDEEELEEACEDVELMEEDDGEEGPAGDDGTGGAEADHGGKEGEDGEDEAVLDEEELEEAYEDVELMEEDDGEEGPAGDDGTGGAEADHGGEEGEDGEDEAVLDEEDLEEACEDVELMEEGGGEEGPAGDDGTGGLEADHGGEEGEDGEDEAVLDEEDLEEACEDVDLVEEGVAGEDDTDGLEAGDIGDESGGADPAGSRLLAEEFNRSLAAMDRFYNHYILVPDGSYRVHPFSSNGDGESLVTLSAFYIGRFPVTNALFDLFVERTGYRTTAERLGWGMVYQGRYRRETDEQNGRETFHVGAGIVCTRVEGACWYQPLGAGSTLRGKRNHPVVQVSLEDAMAFASWTGKRLPTGEEWEAAMRTADGNLLPWGDVWVPEACNVEESCIGDTSPVDRFAAFENPLGVADGLGNVLEWTSSGGRGKEGVQRIARGGGWIARRSVTLADGTNLFPDARSNILGFRCVAY
ncbi:MAG: SUMF1/EgtB/PvdO family nonheme iron enzyme [Deltaproteobacteria bacterium]|nr:SUMF1/EgtB/PvdO family nonheme iron enzyme [Deltaproteobacteria bacterium]